jgi:5-methylcytosine-specific restriction protein A
LTIIAADVPADRIIDSLEDRMVKYWFTKQDPFVQDRSANPGVWVRPGREAMADRLEPGDLVCIYEVSANSDTGETGGAKSVVALVRIDNRTRIDDGQWLQIAEATTLDDQGSCPYEETMSILGTGNLRPPKFMLLEIEHGQFTAIAKHFHGYQAMLRQERNQSSPRQYPVSGSLERGSTTSPFVKGAQYRRSEIHDLFGGQRQGGISTPEGKPLIFLFTGGSGDRYGYEDEWTSDGVFLYTGEGQEGDMNFTKGNAAVRDSITAGEDIHLFRYVGRGIVEYIGQMVCQGYRSARRPDRHNHLRRAIVFELVPFELVAESQETPDVHLPLDELRRKAIEEASNSVDTVTRTSKTRERSSAVRAYVLKRANGTCEGCNRGAPFRTEEGRPYLEPHHVRRLSDGGPDHPSWVAALCPNCHARAHHAKDKQVFNDQVRQIILRIETTVPQ